MICKKKAKTLLLIGDWNARKDENMGLGSMAKYGAKIINRKGRQIFSFCQINDLQIINSLWYQPIQEKYTYTAEEYNAKSIIDYIVYT